MKKYLELIFLFIISFILAISSILIIKSIREVQPPIVVEEFESYDELPHEEAILVKEIVNSPPERAASLINDIENNSVADISITEVLDSYYSEDELDAKAVDIFSESLETDISETLADYEDAKAERDSEEELSYVAGEVIVETKNGLSQEKIEALFSENQYEQLDENLYKVDIKISETVDSAISSFKDEEVVESVFYNGKRDMVVESLESGISDQYRDYSYEYYLQDCKFAKAYTYARKYGKNNRVTVAVIDNGFDTQHKEIKNAVLEAVDMTTGEKFIASISPDTPQHGTACASIIGAMTNNGYPLAGVAQGYDNGVDLLCLKVSNAKGFMSDSNIYKAFKYATDNGAKVISISIGWYYEEGTLIHKAIDYAVDNGVTVVASAGNSNCKSKHYPSDNEKVISVASSDTKGNKAIFSNYGKRVDVVAPGQRIFYAIYGQQALCTAGSGTSYSAPIVASAIALMYRVNPNITPAKVQQILKESENYLGTHNWEKIDAFKGVCPTCRKYEGLKKYRCSDCSATRLISKRCECKNYNDEHFNCGLLNAEKAVRMAYEII